MQVSYNSIQEYLGKIKRKETTDALTRIYFRLLLSEATPSYLYNKDLLPAKKGDAEKKQEYNERLKEYKRQMAIIEKLPSKYKKRKYRSQYKKENRRVIRKPGEMPHNYTVQYYQRLTKKFSKWNFLRDLKPPKDSPDYDRGAEHNYQANPEVIKSIVRHYSLSEKEALILKNIYLNPLEQSDLQNVSDILGEIRKLGFQRSAKQSFLHHLNLMLKTRRKLKFMDMFSGAEDAYVNIRRYYDTLQIPERYYTGKDRISKFLMDRLSSRIAAENNIVSLRDEKPEIYYGNIIFHYREVLMHLCLYPHLNSSKIPWDPETKDVLLLRLDHDLCKPWEKIIEFIEKQRGDHFIVRILDCEPDNPHVPKLLTDGFRGYIGEQLKALKNGEIPILSEIPFKIQLNGKKDVMTKRLRELHKYLDEK